jgi:hypothetical protein
LKLLTAGGLAAAGASAGWANDELALDDRPRARGMRGRARRAEVERIILVRGGEGLESGEVQR